MKLYDFGVTIIIFVCVVGAVYSGVQLYQQSLP